MNLLTDWFCLILKIDWERGLRRLKNWVSLNYDKKFFKSKFKSHRKNWMQSYFWFLKLMPLGQNEGKSISRHCPKIKNLKIGFDTWIPFSFLIKKHPLLQFFGFKIMDLQTLSFCTFWGPSLHQFSKLDKIIGFTWFITQRTT